MSAGFAPGPWFALDQRASTLREMGYNFPLGAHDQILIVNYPPSEINAEHCDCVVARISLSNRSEELGESNMADGHLIAAAPDLYVACELAARVYSPAYHSSPVEEQAHAKLIAALAKARGEAR